MKGIDSSGSHLVHVPGWVDRWMGGWLKKFKKSSLDRFINEGKKCFILNGLD